MNATLKGLGFVIGGVGLDRLTQSEFEQGLILIGVGVVLVVLVAVMQKYNFPISGR